MLLVWRQWSWSPKANWDPAETHEAIGAMLHIHPSDQTNSIWSDIKPQDKKDDTHMSHMAPIYKSLGHLDIFLGKRERKMGTQHVEGQRWMDEPKESPKGKTNTHYPFDSVILAPNHVNRVRRSWENQVMDQWWSMMIKPLVEIITSRHTPMKC